MSGPRQLAAGARRGTVGVLGPLGLLVGAAAATSSVSRYDLRIVLVYAVLAAALAVHLVRAVRRGRAGVGVGVPSPLRTPAAAGAVLLGCALGTWLAPTFTYLDAGPARTVRLVLAGAAVLAGLALLTGRTASTDLAFGLAVLGHVTAAVLLVHGDPAPRIDVWVMLQQGADATARGADMYTQTWSGSPGVQDAFTYLPWMGLLVSPGRWLAGDVRWALLAITVAGAALPWWVSRRRSPAGAASGKGDDGWGPHGVTTALACLVLLLPGTATQVEQAWTEPVLLTCLTGWFVAVRLGRGRLAVACLGVGLACKQHVWPLLAIMAAWRRFGLRRTAAAVVVAVVLMSPWLVADPAAMREDTVTLLVNFRALLFADTLYIAAIHELGVTPPFWLTGAVLAVALGLGAVVVRRADPDPGTVLRIVAAVLLVANLVNKQAFYNQYWLVMTLVIVSWMPLPDARPQAEGGQAETPSEATQAEAVDA